VRRASCFGGRSRAAACETRGMADLVASRTLVKSPPELWNELSDADGLSRHLGEFGDIKISRLEPERAIAWEAEHATGTVQIVAAGWGTKVVLTADVPDADAETKPLPEPAAKGAELAQGAEPAQAEEPAQDAEAAARAAGPSPREGLLARWLFRSRREMRSREPGPETEPEAAAPVVADQVPEQRASELASEPWPAGPDVQRALTLLEEALDSLGSAHHRPFSRG
jgi:hypothetical protein